MSAIQPKFQENKIEPKQRGESFELSSKSISNSRLALNTFPKSSPFESLFFSKENFEEGLDHIKRESVYLRHTLFNSNIYPNKFEDFKDKGPTLKDSSNVYYKSFLETIKNSQLNIGNQHNLYLSLKFKQPLIQKCLTSSDIVEPNHLLNESLSTTHSTLTTAIHSPKNSLSKQTSKNANEEYLELSYPEIYFLQQKYSKPNTRIEVKRNSIYFIIKSFNIENIHKAIKYGVWSTTYSANLVFDKAYNLAHNRNADVYLFFSTNSTFAFQGIARLKSRFQTKTYSFWKGSEKYKSFNGSFNLDWIIIKDIPYSTLDIIQANNIPFSKLRNGVEVNERDSMGAVSIFSSFYYYSSIVLSEFMGLDIEEKTST